VAREICRLTGARLVDNHLLNNPIFTLVRQDGSTPFPPEVWLRVRDVRNAVLETLATLAPRDLSFIFTNELVEGDPDDRLAVDRLLAASRRREARYIPVRMLCEGEELARRVVGEDRRRNLKSTCPDRARRRAAEDTVLLTGCPGELTIDVTRLLPEDSALAIIGHAAQPAAEEIP
jgi:hypothetical protein